MMKFFFLLICLSCTRIHPLEAAPYIDASVDSQNSQPHLPLIGTLTITHSKEEKIDPLSFAIDGKPLEVSFVKEVKMSAPSETLVSIYSFQLPPQEKGYHTLPSIGVKVGNKIYQAAASSYEISGPTAVTPKQVPPTGTKPSSSSKSSTPLIFRLEATVQGPSSLYPGERTKLFYRISYNRSVDLSRSVLPMVHPAHFRKIGDVQIRDYQLKETTVQDLTQEVEASEIGTFSFGPSTIEGYAYTTKLGQKEYETDLLKAQAPVVTLRVKPFPENDQPPSFNGALGTVRTEATLTSPDSVSVGDTLHLEVQLQGITNREELSLPPLQCQPGFSGFFQTGEVAPLAEVKAKTKFFYLELRPLTSLLSEIPSIEFSSFDSSTGKYTVAHTSSIPLKIRSDSSEKKGESFIALPMSDSKIERWPPPLVPLLEIENQISFQLEGTLSPLHRGNIFLILLTGLILLFIQKYRHHWRENRPKPPIFKSELLLKQALQSRNLHKLEEAFWHRLWEKGLTQQGDFHVEKIPEIGPLASIRTFLIYLESLQYGADKAFDFTKLGKKAKQLFQSIVKSKT